MAKLGTVLFLVPLFSAWDRRNGKLFSAQDRNNSKLSIQWGSVSWRIRRQGAGEVITKLDTVLCSAPLCSIWDRLNGKLLTARD